MENFMKVNMDFLPIELCKKIQGKTNIKSLFVYNKEQIINPEIIEKHGDLTDDGYYELTKDCGGPYKFNEVYIYDYKLMLKRDVWVEKEMVYAYTIEQVLKWIRVEKKIYVGIAYMPKIDNNEDVYYPTIQKIGDFEPMYFSSNDKNFNSYEDACISGIEYLMNNNLI